MQWIWVFCLFAYLAVLGFLEQRMVRTANKRSPAINRTAIRLGSWLIFIALSMAFAIVIGSVFTSLTDSVDWGNFAGLTALFLILWLGSLRVKSFSDKFAAALPQESPKPQSHAAIPADIDAEVRELVETEGLKIYMTGALAENDFCEQCCRLRGNVCYCPWCGKRNDDFRENLVSSEGESVPGREAYLNTECAQGHPNEKIEARECPDQPYCIWCGQRLI